MAEIRMYEFDPMQIDIQQFRAVKASVGFKNLSEWSEALRDQDFDALAAAVWCLQRVDNPGLKYTDVHFVYDDILWSNPNEAEGDESGKAPTSTTPGSPPSPTTSAGPESSTTG